MNDISYFDLVQKTLAENWSKYEQPLRINHDDLTTGITLLTKIAVETINREASAQESDSIAKRSIHKFSSETKALSLADKIKAFVEDKAYSFRKACQTGFPFSLLEISATETALKQTLENYGSILFHFMILEGSVWMNEEELDKRFGKTLQQLKASEIAEVCSELKHAYVRNGDNKAGYCLLWLIKQATGCSYEIPDKQTFNSSTVAKVLSKFFAQEFNPVIAQINSANFVEILHYRSSRIDQPLYHEFLDRNSCFAFLNFVIEQLQCIPMDKWPSKSEIITDLLEMVTSEGKLIVAKALASSEDSKTAEVGNHLSSALKATSLREAIPHFNALMELLPNFNDTHVEIIFGRPFIKFRHDKSIFKNDPDFTRRLYFNDMRKVFIHDSLMIGVYDTRTTFGGKGVPPHLLAYDMNTEKMVWGSALTPIQLKDPSLNTSGTSMTFGLPRMGPAGHRLKRVGEYISLQFIGEKKVHFIHPETGEIKSTLELPEIYNDTYDCLHISPDGFAYQMVHKDQDRVLIGGNIINGQWSLSFETKTPGGRFCSFSTHCGFFEDFENQLILFGPTGSNVTIENCLAAEARGDKIYLIEKDPACKDKCFLTIRTLKVDHGVVSDVEEKIQLDIKEADFGNLCQNGQWILFSESYSNKSPIFVDLHSKKVTYSKHKIPSYGEKIINTESGELWTWDQITKNIWKVSPNDVTLMGVLESGRGTTLLHVDKGDHLYFVDIPF
jgi:hypothetical protein